MMDESKTPAQSQTIGEIIFINRGAAMGDKALQMCLSELIAAAAYAMSDGGHLKVKCVPCGHVWIVAYLPMPLSKTRLFAKMTCPKCFHTKPAMAGKHDLTEEERLRHLLLRAHDAIVRDEKDGAVWAQLLTDMKVEIDHG